MELKSIGVIAKIRRGQNEQGVPGNKCPLRGCNSEDRKTPRQFQCAGLISHRNRNPLAGSGLGWGGRQSRSLKAPQSLKPKSIRSR